MTIRIACLFLSLVLLAGCGKPKYAVTGMVTLENGSPLALGRVVIHPMDPANKISATGSILDGKFTLGTSGEDDGVPPGKYKVTFNPPAVNADRPKGTIFDAAYTRVKETPLEITVEAKSNEFNFQLKSKLK